MAAWVAEHYTAEELAAHPEPAHEDAGTQFVIVELWDDLNARMRFTKDVMEGRGRELFPMLMPGHSHEFYNDVSAS